MAALRIQFETEQDELQRLEGPGLSGAEVRLAEAGVRVPQRQFAARIDVLQVVQRRPLSIERPSEKHFSLMPPDLRGHGSFW